MEWRDGRGISEGNDEPERRRKEESLHEKMGGGNN